MSAALKKNQYLLLIATPNVGAEARAAVLDAFTKKVFFFTLPSDPAKSFSLVANYANGLPGFLLVETFYSENVIVYGVREWVASVSLDLDLAELLNHSLSKVLN